MIFNIDVDMYLGSLLVNQVETISNLYFELSNEDRLRILQILNDRHEKLTNISKELDITNQQCMRHLNRLSDIRLIEKTTDGYYKLTPYGEIVLKLHPGYGFLTKHRDYFLTHSVSLLPDEFKARIGELMESAQTPNVMEAISELESIIKDSEEYLWVIIDKRTRSVRPIVAKAVERGVNIRSISPISYVTSLDVKREIVEEDELAVIRAEATGRAEVVDSEKFDVYLYLSEKSLFISFPLEDGTFDYTGFLSSDPKALKFCKDLFLYFWGISEIIPSTEIVKRHLEYVNMHGVYPEYP
jgi:predicted transcriptional regulator